MSTGVTASLESKSEDSTDLEALIERVVERTIESIEHRTQEYPFISSKACARLIGITPEHLSAMRARGEGPPWSGDGRWIRYERIAVLAWLASLPRSRAAATSTVDVPSADEIESSSLTTASPEGNATEVAPPTKRCAS